MSTLAQSETKHQPGSDAELSSSHLSHLSNRQGWCQASVHWRRERKQRRSVMMRLDDLQKKQSSEDGINWVTASFMGVFHLGAIVALFFFTWKALLVAILLWWVSGSLGIGMGYHRLLTHRSYKTPKWVERFLTLCGALALEGGPVFWVSTHRLHHQSSDREGDPHS